jgi:lipopolysaccharide O-acetyltransferase
MPRVRRIVGAVFLSSYRAGGRAWAKLFSVGISGAFASFGARSVIQPPARLVGESRIAVGRDVFVGRGSWLQTLGDQHAVAIEIGDGTRMAGACTISAVRFVRLGEQVLVAGGVYISDHSHAFHERPAPVLEQGLTDIAAVEIGDGAWLGQNVVVCPGVSVGRGAVIGANSVVKDDVPPFAVAVGAPARVVRDAAAAEASA